MNDQPRDDLLDVMRQRQAEWINASDADRDTARLRFLNVLEVFLGGERKTTESVIPKNRARRLPQPSSPLVSLLPYFKRNGRSDPSGGDLATGLHLGPIHQQDQSLPRCRSKPTPTAAPHSLQRSSASDPERRPARCSQGNRRQGIRGG
jgi:hypothetical protein